MADSSDIGIDDLRRRARRRLVGAIVLALGAAVLVPMLLETDPKPLGEDVSIKIPPVDDAKFVNRLSADVAPAKDTRESAAPAPSVPRKSVADAERSVIAPAQRAGRYDTTVAPETPPAEDPAAAASVPAPVAKTAPPVAPAAVPASTAASPDAAQPAATAPAPAPVATPPAPPADVQPKLAPSAASEPVAPPKAAPAAAEKAPAIGGVPREGYAVQLAAFSDDKGANALANRLTKDGYPAYTEPYRTSRGTLWRVRVGPYPTRDAAAGVRDKLKSEGQNGIVAPAR
jgi:DedD protein